MESLVLFGKAALLWKKFNRLLTRLLPAVISTVSVLGHTVSAPSYAAAGAAAAYYMPWSAGGIFLCLAFAGICAVSALRCLTPFAIGGNNRRAVRRHILCIFLVSGFFIGGMARIAAENESAIFLGQSKPSINAISGILLDDPRTSRSGRGLAVLSLRSAAGNTLPGAAGTVKTSASGKATILFPAETIPRIRDFGRGSEITVEGRFTETEQNAAPSAYSAGFFIARGVFVTRPPSALNRLRTDIRIAFTSLFSRPRWGGLALALLIGIRDTLDGELALQYQQAGVSYILALSGMHLAIISAIIAFLLKKPFGIKPAAAIGTLIIIVYTYLVGAQASLERAALMYVIGALTILCAFPREPLTVLSFSFVLQLLARPSQGGSLSFILSYAALAGILIFSTPIQSLFRGYAPFVISSPLSASLAAFTATLGITAVFFGEARPAGILCGLLMVPLTTFFMVGAIVFPFTVFFRPLETIFDVILGLLYTMLQTIASFGAAVPAIPVPAYSGIAMNLLFIGAGWIFYRIMMAKRAFRLDPSKQGIASLKPPALI
jgi:competence protein ComEC